MKRETERQFKEIGERQRDKGRRREETKIEREERYR
jgi:hypothetical protein